LINDGVTELLGGAQWPVIIRPLLETAAGMLLLVGLWTPMAGVLVVMVELWSILTRTSDFRNCATLVTVGAVLAMLGPGDWSIDARLFGRKRIDIREY
jgi:uncharacterized membrane protein YphA (DoxX/SURF4 family)